MQRLSDSLPVDPASDASSKYWAFISYSHSDERWARQLHRAIERYSIPRALVGTTTAAGVVPKRLFPVFRDSEELSSSASLPDSIRQALQRSRNLIVICSPHAVASIWVEREILLFQELGRDSRIFSLIVAGEPAASEKPGSGQPEAFPRALRYHVGPDNQSLEPRGEPLAADVRGQKTLQRSALLKLVAGLLAVDYDALVKRDARARRVRQVEMAIAACAVVAIGIGVWYQQHVQVVQQTDVSSLRQLVQTAKGLVERDTGDLYTGVLLAVEAVHRAVDLHESPERALEVVRAGLRLLPEPVPRQLDGAPPDLSTAELSPDGRWVCVLNGRGVTIWDSVSGRRIAVITLADEGTGLGFPEPGHVMVLTGHSVQTWSVNPLRLVTTREYVNKSSRDAALSRDGRWLAIPRDDDASLEIVDVSTGETIRELVSEVRLHLVRFSPDGSQVAAAVAEMSNVGAQNAGLRVWDRETGSLVAQASHQTYIESLSMAPRGPLVATVAGATIRVIGTGSDRVVQTIPASATPADQQGGSVAISSQGRWVAAGDGAQVRVWDVASGVLVARMPGRAAVSGFSADGDLLLTKDGALWRMNSEAQLGRQMSLVDGVQGMQIAGDPPLLAHGSRGGAVYVWNLDTGRLISRLDEQSLSAVVAMDQAAHRVVVLSGTTIGALSNARVWDIRRASQLAELNMEGQIIDVAFNPDERTVWLLAHPTGIVVFDTDRFEKIRAVPTTAASMRFSADGRHLTLSGGNGPATVVEVPEATGVVPVAPAGKTSPELSEWTMKEDGEERAQTITVERSNTHERWATLAQRVDSRVLTPKGDRLVTVQDDGVVQVQWVQPTRVLENACKRIGRALSSTERQQYLHQTTGPDVCRPLTLPSP